MFAAQGLITKPRGGRDSELTRKGESKDRGPKKKGDELKPIELKEKKNRGKKKSLANDAGDTKAAGKKNGSKKKGERENTRGEKKNAFGNKGEKKKDWLRNSALAKYGGTKNALLTNGELKKNPDPGKKNAFPKNRLVKNGRWKGSRASRSSGLKPMVWRGGAEARIECDIIATAIAFGRGTAEIRSEGETADIAGVRGAAGLGIGRKLAILVVCDTAARKCLREIPEDVRDAGTEEMLLVLPAKVRKGTHTGATRRELTST